MRVKMKCPSWKQISHGSITLHVLAGEQHLCTEKKTKMPRSCITANQSLLTHTKKQFRRWKHKLSDLQIGTMTNGRRTSTHSSFTTARTSQHKTCMQNKILNWKKRHDSIQLHLPSRKQHDCEEKRNQDAQIVHHSKNSTFGISESFEKQMLKTASAMRKLTFPTGKQNSEWQANINAQLIHHNKH